uniref:G-protein coupled receptors family 1 profile domain-containing protein n=1 Tax=Plectus sambesii TaxID=2011161 RepID=A0A914UTS5_9BILA
MAVVDCVRGAERVFRDIIGRKRPRQRTFVRREGQTIFLRAPNDEGVGGDEKNYCVLHIKTIRQRRLVRGSPFAPSFFHIYYRNILILVVIAMQKSMRTVTNFFLANLAVADLLVGIFCVVQNAIQFSILSHGHWPFGPFMCRLYVYILHLVPSASAGILVLLSIERFIAVLRPMLVQHLLTKVLLVSSTSAVWALSALTNSPFFIYVNYIEFPDLRENVTYATCTRLTVRPGNVDVPKISHTVNFFVWYATPLCMLLIIYISIGYVLIKSTSETAVARSSTRSDSTRRTLTKTAIAAAEDSASVNTPLVTRNNHSSAAATLGEHNNHSLLAQPEDRRTLRFRVPLQDNKRTNTKQPQDAVESRKRAIRLVVVIVLSFAILSCPRYVYMMWNAYRETNAQRCINCATALIQPITFLLLFLNSGINPFLYAFLSERFRNAIKDTFWCRRERDTRRSLAIQMSGTLRNTNNSCTDKDTSLFESTMA